jgi:hypothetical protein
MDGVSIRGRCCVFNDDIERIHGFGRAASFNSLEIIMYMLPLVGVVLSCLYGFALSENASPLMSDRDRLDGSHGCIATQSVADPCMTH